MNWGLFLVSVVSIGLWLWFIVWLGDFDDSDFEDEDLEDLWDKNT